ncbi:MAG: glycosyl transferase, partial [Gammaproteobacteria bacterium]|nr:glycosyl transferase [Gammaproteobacteria bacterium]
EAGRPVDEDWRSRRRQSLVERYAGFAPHILVIEAFPFDRRQMRFELMPLLAAAEHGRNPPLVVASVRDVVHRRQPSRIAQTITLLRRYFDRVLVHGDPLLVRFEESFPAVDEIRDLVTYTGYVGNHPQSYQSETIPQNPEVVVSAGGGAASMGLFLTAMHAKPRSRFRNATWRFLAGDSMSETDYNALRDRAGPGSIVERARSDFPALLARCAVSVSRGGYNTVVDLLRARARSVIVPYAGSGETEQPLRARFLEQRGYARVLDEKELSAQALATAVDQAATVNPPPAGAIDLDGAVRSADLLIDALRLGQQAPGTQ